MREVVLRVPAAALEEILDRLLPIVPGGVRERPIGRYYVELRMRGSELPTLDEVARTVERLPHQLDEHEISDDWRERRLLEYVPDLIGERLVIRPEWGPAADPGVIDVVLSESSAFGGGTHPTTRACLELLLELAPSGSFADLGCGSGVLAIVAARLGWAPILALDVRQASVATARENAERNDTAIEVELVDLVEQPAPIADGFAANVPAPVHHRIAAGWATAAPRIGLLSGFGESDADEVIQAYAPCGLRERRRVQREGWVVAELEHE
jgi:ribosomal protein L11 methyltransferase